jgi:hypothetical protein
MINKRTYISVSLILIMLAMIVFLALNYNKIFIQQIIITYPDGCKEIYIEGNITTPNCTIGRLMEKQQEEQQQWWLHNNITILSK